MLFPWFANPAIELAIKWFGRLVVSNANPGMLKVTKRWGSRLTTSLRHSIHFNLFDGRPGGVAETYCDATPPNGTRNLIRTCSLMVTTNSFAGLANGYQLVAILDGRQTLHALANPCADARLARLRQCLRQAV